MRIRDRETGDLLVLMIAGIILFVVVITTLSIIIGEFLNPEHDSSTAASQIGDIINTLIGLLAGYLAGRTEKVIRKRNDEGERPHRP